MRRVWVWVALGCALITAGCTSIEGTAHVVHFDWRGISFDYPAKWRVVPYQETSNVFETVAFLGTGPFHDPCTTVTSTNGSIQSIDCGSPVDTLTPGSVFVAWRLFSFDMGDPGAPNTTIAGQNATVVTQRPGGCSELHADESITATFQRPNHHHYVMAACLRGPVLSDNERLVNTMLNSTKITGDP